MNLKSRISSPLVKDSLIYTFTDALGKGVGFLLLPLVSAYVTPDELGIATNFLVLTSIFSLLGGLAVVNSMPYFYYEQSKEQNVSMVSAILLLCCLLCFGMAALVLVFSSYIETYLKLGLNLQLYAILCVLVTLVGNTNSQLLRLRDKAKVFAGMNILQIFLHFIAVLFFVAYLKWGGVGKVYADTVAPLFVGGIHFIIIWKTGFLAPAFKKDTAVKLVKFAIPLLPHSISFWLKSGIDKIFITQYCGLYQNGLYSMAMTLTSVFNIFSQSFFKSFSPYLQKKLAAITPENELFEHKRITRIIYAGIGVFLILAVFSVFIVWIALSYFIEKSYLESFRFVPWLILSLYIYTIYSFAIELIYKKKKTFVLGAITFTGSVIQMGLGYWLIKTLGIMGAAYAAVIGAFIVCVCIFYYSHKVYPLPWLKSLKR